jgi:alkanesulfonate monooxygenase SsuD/methylene tetrahydromethanopterin reductase-like flavin-dependent oxidoreductase (luciferase family)
MQLQQSHPPILVGAGSQWMLGIAGREANIVCNLPGAAQGTISGELLKRSPQRMVRKVEWVELAAEHLAGTWAQLPARTDSQCANRTGKSLANGSCRPSRHQADRGRTPPELLVWCGAPRRNRTGDPILTMEPPGTAVRNAVFAGRARP